MTELMVCQEELKTAPFGDVWEQYLKNEGVESEYLPKVQKYEEKILAIRK